MESELKPCPFCGVKLIKIKVPIRGYKPETAYQHPGNSCVLAINTDEFEYIVTEGCIEAWNRRAEDGL